MNTRYRFYTAHLANLEGRLLTLIDATMSDRDQRKAVKDILRQSLWAWAIENNLDADHEENKREMEDSGLPANSI